MESYKGVGNPLWFSECSPSGCLSYSIVKISKWQVFCETHDFSPLPLRPTFPLSLYPSLLFGMKEPHFFLFFPFWPSFSCLTGSETRIQPQSSDPQKGCRISDNIKEQIRQSVRELSKRGWSQVLGIILYMGEKKMTMWARRMGLYGKREAVHNSTACLLPHGWVVAVEIW